MTTINGENIPDKDVVLSRVGKREVLNIKGTRIEILEDGSNTDQRFGALNVFIPPGTEGPPQHWHQMHDETFLIISGEVTFYSRDQTVVLKAGDYMVVPPMAPHSFANLGTEEAVMYGTCSPGYYIHYFRLMDKMIREGEGEWTPEIGLEAMHRYATLSTKQMGYKW